jgi:antitoxin PrlF
VQYISRITTKGQVTIPAEIRRLLGVHAHGRVAFVVEDDQVRLAPALSVTERTAGIMKSTRPPLTPQAEKAAAEEAIAEDAAREGM